MVTAAHRLTHLGVEQHDNYAHFTHQTFNLKEVEEEFSLVYSDLCSHSSVQIALDLDLDRSRIETLDFTIHTSSVHQHFYISICISTLPTQHTTFNAH